MIQQSLIARCTLSEQCLPDAPYRAMLCKLHKDMLDEIDRLKAAQPAPVHESAKRVCSLGCKNLGACCAAPMCEAVATTPPAAQPAPVPLTDRDLASACLSYRHDFGLMDETNRGLLMFQAREWARAFGLSTAAAPEKGGA